MPAGAYNHPVEVLNADDATWAAYVVSVAAEWGHDVVFDAIKGLRWTCTRIGCKRAVLAEGPNIYGSAVREHCTP